MGNSAIDIDCALTDPGFFVDNDPHPLWRHLRREDPVHWTKVPSSGFWSVTRYDDIVAVFSEPALFTSTRTLVIPANREMEAMTPEMMGAGQMMIMTDPPLHGAMRRAFNRLFLPRPVGKYATPGREIGDGDFERRAGSWRVRFCSGCRGAAADGVHLRNHGYSPG